MGEVYKARDTRLERTVAIKVSAQEFGERFQREAQAIASLNHPNICTLHDVGPDYLVMEFIDGRELNVSMLGFPSARVLPLSEIDFSDLPPGAPKIVSYDAKWTEDSPEWRGTQPVTAPIIARMRAELAAS